jgi:GT2 family glycosyltransferase
MVSIIIPTYNNLFFTQQIIGMIQQTTKIPYELIIVDNASTEPGMQEYFDFIEKEECPNITIIRNKENLGVARAWNRGIVVSDSTSEYIAILNNDILIGNDCLERMQKAMEANPDIWCLSPAFTRLAMPENWHELELKQRSVPEQIIDGDKGFFFMFRRDIIDKIAKPKDGYFIDEQFGMLWYEDTDLWMRLKEAGHPGKSINNVLIHHFESKTIALIPDAKKYMAENREKFNNKYNIKQNEK